MSNSQPKSTLDGLPKQFVSAMRTLFDIMDDRKTGFVKFVDIESRWHEDETKNFPKGVIESLRKVTPPNGLLSFERFCAGLKICLLRNRSENINKEQCSSSVRTTHTSHIPSKSHNVQARPQSVPADRQERDVSKAAAVRQSSVCHIPNHVYMAAVRPNNVMSQQRAISMPQLGEKVTDNPAPKQEANELRGYKSELKISAPQKPANNSFTRSGIMTALHNWQMGLLMNNEMDGKSKTVSRPNSNRGPGDGKATAYDSLGGAASDGDVNVLRSQEIPGTRKTNNRRREPRRHTLANGIDYNMLKRMKQLEQEKDVLIQGLEAVDRARDWYLKQIATVQDKMKYIGKSNSYVEYSTETHQERLNFQMARIFEVNQHLSALVDTSEKGFPLHMNLAVRQPPVPMRPVQSSQEEQIVRRLKEQNHLLTEEVSKKSERITKLEREKSALIRKIFEVGSQRRDGDETTFM